MTWILLHEVGRRCVPCTATQKYTHYDLHFRQYNVARCECENIVPVLLNTICAELLRKDTHVTLASVRHSSD